ncbi:aspartate/glutamate/uridylate kinase [Solidesulfovibrio carbinoliphilus subsp. oakridgensis]|uniref:Aspartate/glutamate/uridylate kinase n=1 Tax=Solidesulfovibrio carbinoliphilus subsp. oakridgensis TaxID=694327 RepID=G7Q859_9BACT|nr:uridine monophosphate kinase [Solidesulfovibrio carbinoliphilus]EHJ48073.1 aspartate/glutamate/uridylate kinase [Solidesulfovibrio carbinoliphilus subsp. oakridgensis]
MGKLVKEGQEGGRLHIESPLMGESLVSRTLLSGMNRGEVFRMHPDVNVLKIGGQSIMDRGAKALLPIIDVLLAAKEKHKIILMTGGGTRARHIYNIGLELGMPTGVLSKLGDKVASQNAEILSVLLAKHGGVRIGHGDHLEQLTMFCQLGYLPITPGIPPYGFFEHPAEEGLIPPHRTDCGAFLLAENIGGKSLIYLKDEKGLYSGDPKKAKDGEKLEYYGRLSVDELIALDLDDLIVERPVLRFLKHAKCIKEFQIIDALRHPEHILAALDGEHVGTVIYKD